MAWLSWVVLAVSGLLAVPTSIDPAGGLAGPTYLAGLSLIVVAMWWGTARLPRAGRGPWVLLSAAASGWLAGDIVQRAPQLLTGPDGIGLPDVFWLGSYPLLMMAVVAMIRARGLPADLLREIRLDVIVVGAAAAVGAWRLLIAPTVGAGASVLATIVNAAYPLGDAAIFALALTLLMTPGRRGTPSLLVIGCLGLTLPVDFLQAILPTIAQDFDSGHLDGALLVINGLLAAAAVHPRRGELTRPAVVDGHQAMHRWRVILLGTSLCAVLVLGALPGGGAWNRLPSLVVSIIVSVTVVIRFYRVVRGREAAETALTFQAHHDQLTGAANRTLLMDRLAATMHRNAGPVQGLVLVFIDLDGFKTVNDTWGHAAGDEVLRETVRRLTALVRPTDTVARVGGDEFVVVCQGVSSIHAETLGRRIRDTLRAPIGVGPHHAQVGVSIGVLTATPAALQQGADGVLAAEDLLRRADSAMYDAKRSGGGVRMTRAPQSFPEPEIVLTALA